MGYIYMLTSPSGKSYIGQTTRPIEVRLEEHQKENSACVAIYGAIKNHGWENFKKDWYECPDEDLNKHEELMVEVLGTLAPGGYNLIEGGGNTGKRSEETKQRMSEARRGEKNPMYGKTPSEETIQKRSEALLGHTVNEETRQKLSEAKKGDKNHMYGKTGDKNHNSKKVYQYDLDGNFIRSFTSGGEAARHLKKNVSANIRACARGDRNIAYGFKWSDVQY